MPDEVVLGSIELDTLRSVRWTRVTVEEGWARALLRVLNLVSVMPGDRLIKLFSVDGGHFQEVLRFRVP